MSKQKLTPDVIVRVEKSGNRYNAWDTDGVKRTSEITSGCRKNAFNGNYLLGRFPAKSKSGFSWRKVSDDLIVESIPSVDPSPIDVPTEHAEVLSFIHGSYSLKPKGLMMSELKWKYLIRSGVRGKNIMMTGTA